MRLVLFVGIFFGVLVAQTYTQGKIDMHGGDDSYSGFSSYEKFPHASMNRPRYLDKNTTKHLQKDTSLSNLLKR